MGGDRSPLKTSLGCNPVHGMIRQQPVKVQGAKFKTTEISQLKFLKHRCILYRFKGFLVVNPTTVSDFKKALQRNAHQTIMLGHRLVTEKHSHFSSQREESQKAEIEITF